MCRTPRHETFCDTQDISKYRVVARARVIQQDLGAKPGRRRQSLDTNPRHTRIGYEVNLTLTIPEGRELEKRAAAERRSLSSHVARLVVGDLGPTPAGRGCA